MNYILKVNNVSKRAKDFQILKNVSFELKKGEIVGLIGPNGAGKTSIMKILVGLTKQYEGEVDVSAVRDIGSMIETPNFYPYETGYQNLLYFARLNGVKKQRVNELLKLLGLSDAANKRVKNYSLGMRQRLGIAQALIKDPDVLILDEPTNGLDPEGIYEIREYIKKIANENNITVLISSHLLGELEKMCDRAIIVKHGEIIDFMSLNSNDGSAKMNLVIESMDGTLTRNILEQQNIEILDSYENSVKIRINEDEKNNIAALLAERHVIITGMYEESDMLEDAFLELMKE